MVQMVGVVACLVYPVAVSCPLRTSAEPSVSRNPSVPLDPLPVTVESPLRRSTVLAKVQPVASALKSSEKTIDIDLGLRRPID